MVDSVGITFEVHEDLLTFFLSLSNIEVFSYSRSSTLKYMMIYF